MHADMHIKNILQYEELSGETGYTCPTTLKKKGDFRKKNVKIDSFEPLLRCKNILLHDDFSKTQMFKNICKSYGNFHDQNLLVIRGISRLWFIETGNQTH